jgi:mono/diheme cytochrome c family protein
MIPRAVSCVVGLAMCSCVALMAQTTGHRNPPLASNSLVGHDLFKFYCATCHGRDGRGAGPVAQSLKIPPPDLTRLARRNNGTFPRTRVEQFVANGGDVLTPAHGSADMPVWGPVFLGLDPSDMRAKTRITNLVDYLASIQVKEQ